MKTRTHKIHPLLFIVARVLNSSKKVDVTADAVRCAQDKSLTQYDMACVVRWCLINPIVDDLELSERVVYYHDPVHNEMAKRWAISGIERRVLKPAWDNCLLTRMRQNDHVVNYNGAATIFECNACGIHVPGRYEDYVICECGKRLNKGRE